MKWIILIIVTALIAYYINKRSNQDQNNIVKEDAHTSVALELKTIPGEKQDSYRRNFKTKVVGVSFKNIDGSSRQEAIERLKIGQRLQLAWNPSDPHDNNAVLVFGEGDMSNAKMDTCIGHLKADLAADVVEWVTRKEDEIEGIYAEVSRILWANDAFPIHGCIIELMIY